MQRLLSAHLVQALTHAWVRYLMAGLDEDDLANVRATGIHIAYMEMRYAAALFFRECRGAKLASTTTDESMEMENYFVITPKSHRCEITLKA